MLLKKIASVVCKIAKGSNEKLHLGNVSVQRDWGWAPEYVKAMFLMLQQDEPDDYIIATGETYSLQDFVLEAFTSVGLDWQDHVEIDQSLYRPTDISVGRANPIKAEQKLGWKANYKMPDVVRMMVKERMANLEIIGSSNK